MSFMAHIAKTDIRHSENQRKRIEPLGVLKDPCGFVDCFNATEMRVQLPAPNDQIIEDPSIFATTVTFSREAQVVR